MAHIATPLETVLGMVKAERGRQAAKHGEQWHLPDGTGPGVDLDLDIRSSLNYGEAAEYAKARCKAASQNEGGDGSITFEHILTEEFFEAVAEDDKQALFRELVQVAAVATQWCEKLYREGVRP